MSTCPNCKYCGGNLLNNPRPDTPHYAEWKCEQCQRHNGWIQSPNKNRNKNTIKKAKEVFKKPEGLQCCFCDRYENQLGDHEVITIDHEQELRDGGADELYNMRPLCTACHKLRNWVKLYLNIHLLKYYEKE